MLYTSWRPKPTEGKKGIYIIKIVFWVFQIEEKIFVIGRLRGKQYQINLELGVC